MTSTQAKLDALRDASPGGSHYRRRGGVQPIDLIEAQRLGPHEAAIVGYVTRWRSKNGVADLQKAKWYLDRLLLIAAASAAKDESNKTLDSLRHDGVSESTFDFEKSPLLSRISPAYADSLRRAGETSKADLERAVEITEFNKKNAPRADEDRRAAEIAAYNDGYKGWCE